MLTIDTSALVAMIAPRDPNHDRVLEMLLSDAGPYILAAGALAEATYMMQARVGARLVPTFVQNILDGAFSVDCGENDFPRVHDLVTRYLDLPLGFADAAVIACAERNGGRVLTFDRRDFEVVARGEGNLTILP